MRELEVDVWAFIQANKGTYTHPQVSDMADYLVVCAQEYARGEDLGDLFEWALGAMFNYGIKTGRGDYA